MLSGARSGHPANPWWNECRRKDEFVKPISRSLYLLKGRLEDGLTVSFHLSSAIETLRINGYEYKASQLAACNGDRDRLLSTVTKIIDEMPLAVMVDRPGD